MKNLVALFWSEWMYCWIFARVWARFLIWTSPNVSKLLWTSSNISACLGTTPNSECLRMSLNISVYLPTSVSEVLQKSLNIFQCLWKESGSLGVICPLKVEKMFFTEGEKSIFEQNMSLKKTEKKLFTGEEICSLQAGKCSLHMEKESFKNKICPLKTEKM